MTRWTCDTCEWFQHVAGGPVGHCHRNPPQGNASWPEVHPDDWCGEHVTRMPEPEDDQPPEPGPIIGPESVGDAWHLLDDPPPFRIQPPFRVPFKIEREPSPEERLAASRAAAAALKRSQAWPGISLGWGLAAIAVLAMIACWAVLG